MQKKVFIFIGRSGCGKGTQAKLLIEKLKEKNENAYYVATGDEFRKVFDLNTYTSNKLKEIASSGNLCPSFAAVCMWATALFRDLKEDEHIIIDGTPRSLAEESVLDSVFSFYDAIPVAIYINVSSKWATDRLLARGRGDDTVLGIQSRMNFFEKDIMPIIEKYKSENKIPVFDINGEQTIEEVKMEMFSKLGLN